MLRSLLLGMRCLPMALKAELERVCQSVSPIQHLDTPNANAKLKPSAASSIRRLIGARTVDSDYSGLGDLYIQSSSFLVRCWHPYLAAQR